MISLLLAGAVSGAFSISDKTDNISGDREVYALQITEDPAKLGFIYLRCDAGTPRVLLELYDVPKTEWTIITVDTFGDGPPLNFRRSDDIFRNLVYQGDSDALVARLAANARVTMNAHYDFRDFSFTFSMSGIGEAWKKVVQYCPSPDV